MRDKPCYQCGGTKFWLYQLDFTDIYHCPECDSSIHTQAGDNTVGYENDLTTLFGE